MEDLSRVTGGGISVHWKGEDFILDGFGFDDWGLLQAELIRRKRKQKLQTIADMRDSLPLDIWNEQFDKARKEAESLNEIPGDEINEFLNSELGIAFVLWVLFERRYPGRFSKHAALDMITAKAVTEESMADLMSAFATALGMETDEGNSTDQSKSKRRKS